MTSGDYNAVSRPPPAGLAGVFGDFRTLQRTSNTRIDMAPYQIDSTPRPAGAPPFNYVTYHGGPPNTGQHPSQHGQPLPAPTSPYHPLYSYDMAQRLCSQVETQQRQLTSQASSQALLTAHGSVGHRLGGSQLQTFDPRSGPLSTVPTPWVVYTRTDHLTPQGGLIAHGYEGANPPPPFIVGPLHRPGELVQVPANPLTGTSSPWGQGAAGDWYLKDGTNWIPAWEEDEQTGDAHQGWIEYRPQVNFPGYLTFAAQ